MRAGSKGLALALALAACGGLKGSGAVKTETRAVSGFTQIEIATTGDGTIAQTGADSLTIEAEDNLLPHLTSTVANGRLTIGADARLRPTRPVRYTITVKDLSRLDLLGSGDFTATGIHAGAITVHLSGAGNVKMSGRAESEEISLTGAGNYDASSLATRAATVAITGAGDAIVNATDTLDATVTGAGNVEYNGDPRVTKNITGAGSVRKR
jgi:Putative auto-transporter adhesin, head GIN domain